MRNRRWNNYNQHSSAFRLSRDNRVRDDEFDDDEVPTVLITSTLIKYVIKALFNKQATQELTDSDIETFNRYAARLSDEAYRPDDEKELQFLVKLCISIDPTYDLNWIDVSKITNMNRLFTLSEFNGDISRWDVSKVKNMDNMFSWSKFNGDISNWDVSNVESMKLTFYHSEFNGDISDWDVSKVTDMYGMFWNSKFNGDISGWDVSSVTDMSSMFAQTNFNKDISNWAVSHVQNMSRMFDDSEFNGDISGWDVSGARNMQAMFNKSKFTGDISDWNTGNVENMKHMFCHSVFNGDISSWDVSHVNDMQSMFMGAVFNGDISGWDVDNVLSMEAMFERSAFTRDISNWKINPSCNTSRMFSGCNIDKSYRPKKQKALREAASNFNLRKGATVHDDEFDDDEVSVEDILQRGMKYQLKKIIDRILDETALENEIEYFKEKCLEYNGVPFYKVQKKEQLLQLIYTCIDYLGVNCNLNWIDISYLTDLSYLFIETEFNGNISLWDTSNIKNMSYMFLNSKFNGDISDWNVSKVTNMRGMFKHSRFNSDISNWDVSNVQNMAHMFDDSEFRGDISRWNTRSLNMFEDMFKGCPINKEFKPRSLLQLSESAFNLQRNNRVSNVEFDDVDMNNTGLATTRLYKRLKNNKEKFDKINEFFSESRLYLDEKGYLISHRDVELKKDCPFIDEDGHLTIQFKSVDGDFSCPEGDNVALCSLEGCPEIVGGSFNCKHAVLDNLNGGPLHVGRYYYCGDADPAEVAAQCEVEKGNDYIITSTKTKELFDLLIKQ